MVSTTILSVEVKATELPEVQVLIEEVKVLRQAVKDLVRWHNSYEFHELCHELQLKGIALT